MGEQKEYIRNKEGSNIGKIVIDRDLCIGAAACLALGAEVYEIDDENKAIVTNPDALDDATLTESAESCPVKAILLFDKEGNQVFPK